MERVRQHAPFRAILATVLVGVTLLSATAVHGDAEIRMGYVNNAVAGLLVQVPVTIVNTSPGYELGGFDLLLRYSSKLSLQGVTPGALFNQCQWEYLTQRVEASGALRIIGVADVANGTVHPICYAQSSGELVKINFMVPTGQAVGGEFIPLKWWWYGCTDNSLPERYGYLSYISDQVFDFNGTSFVEITANQGFPTMRGAPDSCASAGAPQTVDFYNGGVRLAYIDTIPPEAMCPGDITQANDAGQCGAVVTWQATVTDNNPGAMVWCTPTSGTYFPVGTSDVRCIAVDTAGNVDTCRFQITVVDEEYPDFPTPSPITVPNAPGECGAVVTYQPQATDNCPGLTMQLHPPSGTYFQVGSRQVLAIAIDATGKYRGRYFTVTVQDTGRPVVQCPGDTTVAADPGDCGTIVTFTTSATDNCGSATVVSTPVSGSRFRVGVTPVTVVATDAAGNTDTCIFTVTVLDTQPPEITCPGDITVYSDSGFYGAFVSYQVSAEDNCRVETITSTPLSGSFFPVGVTTVQAIAADHGGLADTCVFTVTVELDDPDGDSIPTWADNCPYVANHDQADADGDEIGDACDKCTDTDGDEFANPGFPVSVCAVDNCPSVYNPDQGDADLDEVGDLCDACTDTDGDGFGDPGFAANTCAQDNCPSVFNPDQADADGDGVGDVCDECTDLDGDGYGDPGFAANTCTLDNCPSIYNLDQSDADQDGLGDVCDECTDTDGDGYGDPGYAANTCSLDNCPSTYNPDQADADHDGAGDVCDECTDLDGDGYGDPGFAANTCTLDNCPSIYNPEQSDADQDGLGDVCDECTDTDGDGLGDPGFAQNTCAVDNCPTVSNLNQTDADRDGSGDACDECTDLDGDGYGDPGFAANTCAPDNCPADSNSSQADANHDGIGDACCCVWPTIGNMDESPDGLVTMGDLTVLIDVLFITVGTPPCPISGNLDQSPDGLVTMGDLTVMIDNLFITLTPLPPCP